MMTTQTEQQQAFIPNQQEQEKLLEYYQSQQQQQQQQQQQPQMLIPNNAQEQQKLMDYLNSQQQQQQIYDPQSYLKQQQCCEEKKEFVIDLDGEQKISSSSLDLNSIKDNVVFDEIGYRHTMEDLWKDFKTIFVFIRSFLCFTSKEYVEDLAKVSRDLLKEKQVRLIVIGCADWKHIKEFRSLTKYPYLIYCDPEYELYNKCGMIQSKHYGKVGDSIHVKSSNLYGMLGSAYRAMFKSPAFDFQGRMEQQGGSMIIGPGSVLHYLHNDKHARDHTPINTLLEKCGIPPIDFSRS